MAFAGHQTVLREEAVDALVTRASGHYVDCTYGRGGHAGEIARRLGEGGRLLVIDRDETAVAHALRTFAGDPRVSVQHGAFSKICSFVGKHGMGALDGVLMDLGVSSPQLDDATRGFSFSKPGPLDMRMDTSTGRTAGQWLAQASEAEIAEVLANYGEERFSRRIARKIVDVRALTSIVTTDKLVEIVEAAIPRRDRHKHPATRTFQALRIQVNDELAELETCLGAVIELLAIGGRIVVVSFQSLEDRVVKRFLKRMEKGDELPSRLPVRDHRLNRRLRLLGRVRSTVEEVARNPRARSSIMRMAEKLA